MFDRNVCDEGIARSKGLSAGQSCRVVMERR